MSDIKVSIDRLTVVGSGHEFINLASYPELPGLISTRNGDYQILARYFVDEVEFVENLAFINFFDFGKDKSGIRVDFNPNNKKNKFIDRKYWETLNKVIFHITGKKKLSRLDIAFDVFNNDMKYFRYLSSGRKRTIYSRAGDIETIYYGSNSSDKQVRQYNKQVEQLSKGNRSGAWWRLELQLRSNYIDKCKDEVEELLLNFKYEDWSFIDNVMDKALMIAISEKPEIYGELSKFQKTKVNKYRKMLSKSDLTIELLEAYEDQKNNLKSELYGYVSDYEIIF